jgi:hypothetical protein
MVEDKLVVGTALKPDYVVVLERLRALSPDADWETIHMLCADAADQIVLLRQAWVDQMGTASYWYNEAVRESLFCDELAGAVKAWHIYAEHNAPTLMARPGRGLLADWEARRAI